MPTPRPRKATKATKARKPLKKAVPPPAAPIRHANEVDLADTTKWIQTHRAANERLITAVAKFVDPNGVYFDVGANIGHFTKTLAERAEFRGTVHLFEPIPNLARLIGETLADVPYSVHIHAFGLSDEDAAPEIHMSTAGNLGWNTLIEGRVTPGMVPIHIEVKAFATCGITDIPSFIKIDVEGAEYLVLNGMMDALSAWPTKPVILCEVGWGRVLHPEWAQELEAFDRLWGLGYRATDLDGQPVDIAALERTTDLLFMPTV